MLLEGNLNAYAVAVTAGGAALAVAIQLVAWRRVVGRRGGKVQ